MGNELTTRQREVYDALTTYMTAKGYAPSVRELGALIGSTSTNTASGHLDALERKGYITRDSGAARAISIVTAVIPADTRTVIPSPAELLAPQIDAEAVAEGHVRTLVAAFRAKPTGEHSVRDVPAVVNIVGARFAAAGYAVTYVRGGARDRGRTDTATITAKVAT
jgi:SOS-response transcriptional repressor LexA